MLTKIKIGFKVLSQVYNWDCIFLHYLGWKKNTCTVKLRNGTKCIIRNKSDAIAFLENFFLETYEQGKEFQIKDNDIILDVGAHIGCFTLYASKKINKGKIFAFEPTSESFNVLKQNVELNQLKNIHIQNAGVLKESGTSVIYVDKNNEIGNSLFLKNKNMVEEKIDIISIEDILKKYPRIKLKYGFNHRYHSSIKMAKKIIEKSPTYKIYLIELYIIDTVTIVLTKWLFYLCLIKLLVLLTKQYIHH